MRRRLYLMRHGAVSYFGTDGAPVREDEVALNEEGRGQAAAARDLLAGIEFDRVLTSSLPRTIETARIVAPGAELEEWPDLRELRGASLAQIPSERLEEEFVHAFRGIVPNDKRFLGGETIGELFDRVLPAVERILADDGWDTLLAVLHGAVNRAILSYALTAERMFLGHFEQAPACINVLDIGARPESASADSGRADTWGARPESASADSGRADTWGARPESASADSGRADTWGARPESASADSGRADTWGDEWPANAIVRAVNVAPLDLLHTSTRLTTMEGYWEEFRAGTQ